MKVEFSSNTPEHAILSNFANTPFTMQLKAGTYRFANAEAAFQVCKVLPMTVADIERFRIMPANIARNEGKKVALRPDWDTARLDAMRWVLKAKFASPLCREALLAYPVDTEFIHIAPWDGFWGTGKDGHGQNMMGQMIGELRKKLS